MDYFASLYITMQIPIILMLIIFCYMYVTHVPYSRVTSGTRAWAVSSTYNNSQEAAALLSKLHTDVIYFMRAMREKYQIDFSELPAAFDGGQQTSERTDDKYKIMKALIKNYNADMIFENDPQKSSDTAYTVNKGDSLYFCLRNRTNPNTFIPYNTMMFALLHELSHMANYNAWGHTKRFWEVFTFVLHEARGVGIYAPEDYARNPQVYCGLTINYNPLFDKNVQGVVLG